MVAITKKTFILEDDAGKALGTFTGATPGVAAKKAATKGHKNIVLRQTGEHDKVRVYKGETVKLATPKTVMIAGKPVTIAKESKAVFVKVVKKESKDVKPKA